MLHTNPYYPPHRERDIRITQALRHLANNKQMFYYCTMAPQSKLAVRIPVVRAFIRQTGRAPTLDELRQLFNLSSRNTASVLATKLVEAGVIARTETGRLAVHPSTPAHTLRILGSIAAGIPSPAEEALLDTLTLDEYLLHRPEATFMLTVEGDSMIEAGILPGDSVLVERGRTAKNGDIVVACVDNEWTLKYFYSDHDGLRLEPANPRYSTIRPSRHLSIDGVVCGVVRKLA